MRKAYYLIIILFITGCTSPAKLFSSIKQSEQSDYGYSANNPILIGYYPSWQKNTQNAWYYLSKLEYNGKPLQFVMHATVGKPANQPRAKKIYKLLGTPLYGAPLSLGGNSLDLFVMVPRGTSDTLGLFFDVEIKGEVMIPKGFVFNINQNNNIYK